MNITLNIQVDSVEELARVATLLAGSAPQTEPVNAPQPQPGAVAQVQVKATKRAASKTAGVEAPTATVTVPADTLPGIGEAPAQFSEADITAAANDAMSRLNSRGGTVDGTIKIKNYIAENFQQQDGSPGTLKTTRTDQRAKLLAALQAVARGDIQL